MEKVALIHGHPVYGSFCKTKLITKKTNLIAKTTKFIAKTIN